MIAAEYARSFEPNNEKLKVKDTLWYFFLNGEIHPKYVNFYLTFYSARDKSRKFSPDEFPQNPSPQYLKKSSWAKLTLLSKMPEFSHFAMEYGHHGNKATTLPTESCWEDLYHSASPWNYAFPDHWNADLSHFEKLLVIQSLRPDSLVRGMEHYVAAAIGPEFLESVCNFLPNNPSTLYPTPAIIFTETLTDVVQDLKRIALARRVSNFLNIITIGQETDERVLEFLNETVAKGRWLIIQSCETNIALMESMNKRLYEIEGIYKQEINRPGKTCLVNPNFRVWFISKSTNEFPITMYSACARIFLSPSRSVKPLIQKLLVIVEDNIAPHEFNSTVSYRSLILKIFMFFIMLLQRRISFPHSGMINDLEFFESDLQMSFKLLRQIYKEKEDRQKAAVLNEKRSRVGTEDSGTKQHQDKAKGVKRTEHSFSTADTTETDLSKHWYEVIGNVSFGAMSGDHWDQRMLQTMFNDVLNTEWTSDSRFIKSFKKILDFIGKGEMQQCTEFVKTSFPAVFDLDSFHLPQNSSFGTEKASSQALFRSIRSMHIGELIHIKKDLWSDWESITSLCRSTLDDLFNIVKGTSLDTREKEPVYTDAPSRHRYVDMTLQENIKRYRILISVISDSLEGLIESITDGEVEQFGSQRLRLAQDLHSDRVPQEWVSVMYKNRNGFRLFISNLNVRLAFIKEWNSARYGPQYAFAHFKGLISYDISCMFYPQVFLQGILL
jgi:hypothetical protein